MKIIKRTFLNLEEYDCEEKQYKIIKGISYFREVGQMADKHLVYCKCDIIGGIEDYEEMYIQERINGKLVMTRI